MAETTIKDWIKILSHKDAKEIFTSLILKIETHFEKSAGGLQELKERSTTKKGELFEAFCKLYLETTGRIRGIQRLVYYIKEVPTEIREILRLPKNDNGIDLVVVDTLKNKKTYYSAVQCKYRHCNGKVTQYQPHGQTKITWAKLSTFIGLTATTGPEEGGWFEKIIMTNCDGVNWKGQKQKNNVTMAKKRFEGLSKNVWLQIAGSEGNKLKTIETKKSKGESTEVSTENEGGEDNKRIETEKKVSKKIVKIVKKKVKTTVKAAEFPDNQIGIVAPINPITVTKPFHHAQQELRDKRLMFYAKRGYTKFVSNLLTYQTY